MTDETLFAAALEQPDPAAYLDAHCPDPAVRRRVEELLAAHAAAGSFLDHPAVGADVTTALPPASDPDVTRTQAATDPDATADPRALHANPDDALAFLRPPTRPGSLGRLAHYEVLEVLGSGGFGTVLKAFDDRLHRVVAVKVLAPQLAASGAARARFLREARTAAAVRDEHVVNVFAVSDDDAPVPFLVMELVAGQTLQGKIDKTGPLPPKEVLRIGSQIARGLAAAHKTGLVHRDIKPANILLENGVERVKVTDFGLARAADDASLSQSGVVAGTPMYMSPEQARGDTLDTRSDLFSLGSVLYVLCTGRPPFRAETTFAVLKRVIEDDPRPVRDVNPEVPRWLADVVAKLHAKSPADRFQTAAEVADLLSGYLAELQQQGTVVSRVAAPPPARKRRRKWVAVGAAVLLLAPAVWASPFLVRYAAGSGTVVFEPADGFNQFIVLRGGQPVTDWNGLREGPVSLSLPPGRYQFNTGYAAGRIVQRWEITVHGPFLSRPAVVGKRDFEFEIGRGERVVVRAVMRDDPTTRPRPKADTPPPAAAPFTPEEARAHQEAWATHLGVPVEFAHPSGLAFRLIPPGEFGMGFTADEQAAVRKTLQGLPNVGAYQRFAAESSGPRHTVRITRPFYLAKYETTAGQFRRFVEAAKHTPTGTIDWRSFVTPGQEAQLPVLGVSWDDATAFCRWLGPGYELPSEAQWEYAARGGSPGLWSFGNDATKLLDHAVFGQAWPKPGPVGLKAANPFGLFDVHGNADEWCRDWHVADYYRRSPIDDPVNLDDPVDPATGRASRGGSWNAAAVYSEVAFRSFDNPTRPAMPKGFRVALAGDLKAAVDAASRKASPPPAVAPFAAEQATAHQEAWAKYLGVPVEFTTDVGMTFRLIPPGKFKMGSTPEQQARALEATKSEAWAADEIRSEALREVEVREPFYLGTLEVTRGQFQKFADAAGFKTVAEKTGGGEAWSAEKNAFERKPEYTWRNPQFAATPDHPVGFLAAADARAFCGWLPTADGLGLTYAVPTEEQWEFACRAGTETLWFTGDDPAGTAVAIRPSAWGFAGGGLRPNPFGLYDTSGNQRELASTTDGVVLRGGGAGPSVWFTRSAARAAADGPISNTHGLRVAVVGDLRKAAGGKAPSGPRPALLRAVPSPAGTTTAVQFLPDGTRLMVGGFKGVAALDPDGTAPYLLPATAAGPGAVLSPDGKTLYRAAAVKTAETGPFVTIVHDAVTGEKLRVYAGVGNALAVSPDGKLLAGDGPGYALVVVETATGKAVQTLTGHTGALRARAFSPDGKRLVSTAEDDTVRVWDVEAGKELFSKPGHGRGEPGGLVGSVAWLPDGSAFLSSGQDGEVRVYDPAGKVVRAWATGQRFVRVLRPDRDGRRLLTVGQESREVMLWDLAPPVTLLAAYPSPADRPFDAAFSPDGATVATAGGDGVVRLWPAPPAEPAWVPLFNGRDLTGWVARAEPGQPPERPWEVRDQEGILTARGAPNGYLRTEKTYRHYTFEAEIEPTAKLTDGKGPWAGDLTFGMPDPEPAFPKLGGVRVQVVPGGSGSVGKDGAAAAVAWPAFRPGWNRLRVESGPDGVTGFLNGAQVFIHRGADAGAGYVAIVSAGTGLRFRDVRLRPAAPPGALVLPAPEPPDGVYAALARARRERVAAAEKGLAAEKARFDAGRVTRREVAEAEAALIEAQLDGAPGAATVRLLGQLVKQHEVRRGVVASRVEGGIQAPAALDAIDADLAKAKARLAEAKLAAPPPAAAPFAADQAKAHQEAWAKHLGVRPEISNDLGMRFRVIPAGSFQMGSTAEEVAAVLAASPDLKGAEAWIQDRVRAEAPARKVTITEPFLLGTHEVTVGQFREFVKATGHKTFAEKTGGGAVWDNAAKTWGQDPEAVWHNPKFAGSESHPVTFLNPADARAFCAWLGKQDGRTYALPTEEQWEFACRAGTTTRWWFGDDPAGMKKFGWTVETAAGKHRPVGQLAANPFGLFDLHGNATEMTTSPQGEVYERGGQANETAWRARAAWRNPVAEDSRPHGRRGFRVAVVGDPRGEAAGGPRR